MSKKNYYLSPQNFKRNKILLSHYNTNFSSLEKEILKLINYLRTNPEKYLNEFNKYFQKEDLDIIIKQINDIDTILAPFNTKREISNAGYDYLDYLIENSEKPYFNFNKVDKTCFNLRARLSKYGQRYGKIFESVIINSDCAEEIVNKLIKDEKARKMILSPIMKYISIICGYLPKFNNICTIIDIVQDFIAYKDIDNISNNNFSNYNNSIQIINTIEFDENENISDKKEDNKEIKQIYKLNNNKYCVNTCKLKSKLNNKNLNMAIDNDNNSNYNCNSNYNFKKNKDKNSYSGNISTFLERKKNINYNISRNDYNSNSNYNSTVSGKTKLISPLATYKSDAYLIFNQTHSNLQKSYSFMKRVNSDFCNRNYNTKEDDLTKTQINMAGDNHKHNNISKYNTNNNANINTNNNNNYDKQTFNKIEVSLKNKKYKYSTERIKGKEKIEIIHSLNEIKNKIIKEKQKEIEKENEKKHIIKDENKNLNKLIKEKEKNNSINKSEEKEKNDEIENKLRITNFTLKNIELKKTNNSSNNINNDNNNKEISKVEIGKNDINNDIKNNDNTNNNMNYNISFDNKSYSFFSKENQNNPISINDNTNDNDNENLNASIFNKNKKENSFFSHDTDINNILGQKEKGGVQKKLKVITNKNRNEKETNSKTCSINDINNNINKKDILNNEEENIVENNIDDCDYDNEEYYYHKNKKEIKQLIRLYNKERYEKKYKGRIINVNISNINLSNINNISEINNNEINNTEIINNKINTEESNSNNNNDGSNNKKSTATFFYIKKDSNKDNNKDNIEDNKNKNYNKIYKKQKIIFSNSQNKTVKNNKNNININTNNNNYLCNNYSHKNIKTKKYYLPKSIFNTEANYYKIENNNNKNNRLLTDNNINTNNNNNKNIIYNNFNTYNDKKRILTYKANRSKYIKNRSFGNVMTEDNYNKIEEKQYLSDKNINEIEDKFIKSKKYTIKRISNGNGNDNRETNVNSDNNNDNIDDLIKINVFKCNKNDLKEIKINYIYNNRNNYNTYKENYIYKKNKAKPDKKNSFNFYNKGLIKNVKLNEIKDKYKTNINSNKIYNNNNQNKSIKKYVIPYINTDSNTNNK